MLAALRSQPSRAQRPLTAIPTHPAGMATVLSPRGFRGFSSVTRVLVFLSSSCASLIVFCFFVFFLAFSY